MRLASFSVENYRSITKAYRLPLQDLTVLIGPNNEGKSNILRALVRVLEYVSGLDPVLLRDGRVVGSLHRLAYDWKRDFPALRQSAKPGMTVFQLEFALTDSERQEFKAEVGSTITGTLPIEIAVDSTDQPFFRVAKQGPGTVSLSKKAARIARFIAKRLNARYIPAVRTAAHAQQIVDDLVAQSLAGVERDPKYVEALATIAAIQQPILDAVADTIRDSLAAFLPRVKSVRLEISQEDRTRALRQSNKIVVDDGAPTLLQSKGDGMQSLAALSLMRHALVKGAGGRQLVLAVEEPESHLHPKAIHELRAVLTDISKEHQIILTTHCPLFANRVDLGSNIIVTASKATPAKTISDVRKILGVRVSDNLMAAAIVLLVEGEDDRQSLRALLCQSSRKLRDAVAEGVIGFDHCLGATNIAYKASQVRDAICIPHVFVDNDASGKAGAERAEREGLVTTGDLNFAMCPGMPESELEDLYEAGMYTSMVKNTFKVDLANPKFRTKKKWSVRMQDVFKAHGKPWTDRVAFDVKKRIADIVVADPGSALHPARRGSIDGLVLALEQKLEEISLG